MKVVSKKYQNRYLLVSSNSIDDDTSDTNYRFRFPLIINEAKDSTSLVVNVPTKQLCLPYLKQFLSEKIPLKSIEYDIEYFHPILSKYIPLLDQNNDAGSNDEIDYIYSIPILHLLLIYKTKEYDNHNTSINSNDNNHKILAIKGRLFDISQGLIINNHVLSVNEQSQASLGTGLNTWDGSIILAKYFEHNYNIVYNKNILEVGAGTGVAGIACYYLEAKYVMLTDLKYTLDNLRANIELNNNNNNNNKVMIAAELDWSDELSYPKNKNWDVIIGADVVWLEHLIPSLVNTIFKCSSNNTIIYLSHQTRSERTDELLFRSLDQYFIISKIPHDQYHPDYNSNQINIFKAILKNII
eukprot:gene7417-10109_t